MKKILTIASLFLLTTAAFAQNNVKPKVDELAKFKVEKHSFGKIPQGIPVTYEFEFTNISKEHVVVENAYSSCGCTVPERPEQPIAPGASAKMKIVFNAAQLGPINKEVYVKFAGIDSPKILLITGEVVAEQPAQTTTAPAASKKEVQEAKNKTSKNNTSKNQN